LRTVLRGGPRPEPWGVFFRFNLAALPFFLFSFHFFRCGPLVPPVRLNLSDIGARDGPFLMGFWRQESSVPPALYKLQPAPSHYTYPLAGNHQRGLPNKKRSGAPGEWPCSPTETLIISTHFTLVFARNHSCLHSVESNLLQSNREYNSMVQNPSPKPGARRPMEMAVLSTLTGPTNRQLAHVPHTLDSPSPAVRSAGNSFSQQSVLSWWRQFNHVRLQVKGGRRVFSRSLNTTGALQICFGAAMPFAGPLSGPLFFGRFRKLVAVISMTYNKLHACRVGEKKHHQYRDFT